MVTDVFMLMLRLGSQLVLLILGVLTRYEASTLLRRLMNLLSTYNLGLVFRLDKCDLVRWTIRFMLWYTR
jgi:hypothetical protein